MDQVARTGETIVVTKNGKPIADFVHIAHPGSKAH